MIPRLRDGRFSLQPFADWIPGRNLVGAEVGCFAGEGTATLLASGKFRSLLCVDLWQPGYDDGPDVASRADMAEAERVFLAGPGADPRVIVWRMESRAAACRVLDCSLDLVYIDACHTYEAVLDDLAHWLRCVKLGGWVCGHDYNHPPHPGVTQAVDRVLGAPDLTWEDYSWAKRI